MVEHRVELVGMVLAAGRGNRLRPLTDDWAKPALPFLGRPLLAWALEALHRAGVDRIGVNVHHQADQVVAAVQSWRSERSPPRPEIIVVRERELMGTGGGARGIWDAMGRPSVPVALLNGDVVTDVRLAAHLAAHKRSGAAATLLVSDSGEGRIHLDGSGERVVGLPGRAGPVRVAASAAEVSFVGSSILGPEAFAELSVGPGCLLRDGLSRRLLAQGRVAASRTRDRHRDVGTPTRWWAAIVDALDEGWAESLGAAAAGVVVEPPVWVDPSAVIAPGAHIGPYAVIEASARLGAGARVHHAVVAHTEILTAISRAIRVGSASAAIT